MIKEKSAFSLEGRFVSFIDELGEKPKRLRIATAEGERYIKLSKELRNSLHKELQPGDWLKLSGQQKYNIKTRELKLKADQATLTAPLPQRKAASLPQACVMVCQKSACCKRGAKEVIETLSESLRDRGLEEQVTIKGTGCMKQCKAGPCVVFLPDKARYTKVAPKEAIKLVDKHFTEKLEPEKSKLELSGVN